MLNLSSFHNTHDEFIGGIINTEKNIKPAGKTEEEKEKKKYRRANEAQMNEKRAPLDTPFERKTIRVQCFPLYSILLALGNPTVDYLVLDIEGAELQVLKTVP